MTRRTARRIARRMPRTMQYAAGNGWRFDAARGTHAALVKGKARIALAGSPSDHRSDLNMVARLRRIDRTGLIRPP